MRLSTKSTYGLRAMVSIARRSTKGATSILDISKREGISVAYLEQLLNKLRRSGLVKSVRGPKGGYLLSKEPHKITVGDVVKSLEGNITPVNCVTAEKNGGKSCRRYRSCATKVIWAKLAKAVDDCLESMTLEDLSLEAQRLNATKESV